MTRFRRLTGTGWGAGGMAPWAAPALLLPLLLMILLLPGGGAALAAKDEILIGGTLSKSGRFQGITRPFPKLAEAWARQVNARGGIYLSKLGKKLPVRFIHYDDQTSPPTALKFYERLASVDKVDVFIGPFSSFLTNAALQASITHRIPFFMVEANDSVMFEKPNRWRATGLAPAQWEYKRHAEFYARKRGVKTFALLSRDNLHENQAMEGFGDWLRKAGFRVVYQNVAPKDTKDFSSIILAIKQKKPDVVFLEALSPPFGIAFLKQARGLGLNPKDLVVGHMPVPVIKALGKSAEHIVGSMYSFEGGTADHREYLSIAKEAGFAPWQFSESGIRYTAYKRIEDALKRAGSLDREAVRKAMWATDVTIWGEVRIKHDAKGYGTLHPWPTQIKGGKHVSLWPLDKGVRVHEFKNGRW